MGVGRIGSRRRNDSGEPPYPCLGYEKMIKSMKLRRYLVRTGGAVSAQPGFPICEKYTIVGPAAVARSVSDPIRQLSRPAEASRGYTLAGGAA